MTQTPLTFMAVHAHPDDEVFGTGGTFAMLAARGVRTALVTSNLGEEGEIVDPELDEAAKQAMFPRLAEVRRQELQGAVEALNIQELRLLGYRDSGMAGRPSNNHPDCFHRAVFDEAVGRLVAIIRELKPQVIATYDAFGGYGHPDHLQAHRVALAAFDAAADPRCYPDIPGAWQSLKLYYTAMSRSMIQQAVKQMRESGADGPWNNPEMNMDRMGTPDELISTCVDVRPHIEQKIQALRAHRTQIAPDNFFFTLPPEQRELALGYEYFTLARDLTDRRPGLYEQDMFTGIL
ncbi:N-acetyl-1-D-myo-inositol-2-amino-2-deoxy-alpha-D-glucopyranoside deacetylase [Ktedonobacter racemifer]|uniref:1D-myo-inosityl-2-acetamido-2-deoxy-alpha-D-gluc opyranosidedeacetylase n=1 Tax=Ktedonobacter racemifer DSM 44963 TaxID=485913 RepID=D6U4F9_KTERA|nr:N-acetyl-1-D-myo-inositol-2-amino-2-deoxy-alpha-D-glucopyranoside deacetylase [Ktedonobacter racemifer]EFH81389.1 1D-myo-inosityl-2-acetamido-2-deoxy-alpha-D-gluc opyranosidedeacetylase [Ktedonobacter racemifer DSM 44963]